MLTYAVCRAAELEDIARRLWRKAEAGASGQEREREPRGLLPEVRAPTAATLSRVGTLTAAAAAPAGAEAPRATGGGALLESPEEEAGGDEGAVGQVCLRVAYVYVVSYCYIYVRILLLYVCAHTSIYVSIY